MIILFDKDGITTDCPPKLGREVQFYECVGCKHHGGASGFEVTCWRNAELKSAEEHYKEFALNNTLGIKEQGDIV
jgi:hypothetical protein